MRGAALLGLCSRRRFQAGPRAASETGLLASSAWVRSTRALSSKTASASDGSARLRALEQPWPVVIVGGGPTGLTLGLLLRGLGVSSLILESRQWLTEHPQAHLINHRAMEIFRPLAGLSRDIQDAQPDFEDWRRFVYCQGLTGPLLGTVDHFPRQTDASRPDLSPEPLAHLSQHRLVPLLAARLDALHQCPGVSCHAGSLAIWGAEPAARPVQNDASSRARCEMVMGARAARLEEAAGGRGATLHVDVSPDAAGATTTSSKAFALSTSFVVAADGASSALRRSLGIGSTGEPDMQRLINVHFVWPELASALRSQRREGMLYFVYSSEATAVLVAHDLRRGEFVAQIPHFAPKGVESFPEAACVDILRKVAGGSASSDELPGFSSAPARAPSSFPSLRASSPRILDVRAWRMGGFVADSYHRARTALAGDAAHAFPPAGALGMNTGVGDAQALAWRLAAALGTRADAAHLLRHYSFERRRVAERNLSRSVQNFEENLELPALLGQDFALAKGLEGLLQTSLARALLTPISRVELFDAAVDRGRRGGGVLGAAARPAVEALLRSGKTLRLQFPAHDLGHVYGGRGSGVAAGAARGGRGVDREVARQRGSGLHPSSATQIDPGSYEQATVLGGRLPHFWCSLVSSHLEASFKERDPDDNPAGALKALQRAAADPARRVAQRLSDWAREELEWKRGRADAHLRARLQPLAPPLAPLLALPGRFSTVDLVAAAGARFLLLTSQGPGADLWVPAAAAVNQKMAAAGCGNMPILSVVFAAEEKSDGDCSASGLAVHPASVEAASAGQVPPRAPEDARPLLLRSLEGGWETHRGTQRSGALLVRPDGHVAWVCEQEPRGGMAEAGALLAGAYARILGLEGYE